MLTQIAQQHAISFEGSPGGKWPEGRLERKASFAKQLDDLQEISARGVLGEFFKHVVIHGFDSAGDEEASRLAQFRQQVAVLQQVLNFDGYVISELREFAVECFHEWKRVANAIKEIRIAERNVLRARDHLLADIREHDFAVYNAKHSIVNRHNRTMAAKVFATATRFR